MLAIHSMQSIIFQVKALVVCHNGSVPRWLRATYWNGHREARATMVLLIYVYAVWIGGAGLPMVSRVGWEGLGGWGWVANG